MAQPIADMKVNGFGIMTALQYSTIVGDTAQENRIMLTVARIVHTWTGVFGMMHIAMVPIVISVRKTLSPMDRWNFTYLANLVIYSNIIY